MFGTYPSRDEKDFAYDTARKREFWELAYGADNVGVEGQLLHQTFMARFLSPHTTNNFVLVAHEPGLGKTCLMTAVVEINKRENSNPALVVVPSRTLVEDAITKIAETCTHDIYTKTANEPGISDETRQKRIRAEVLKRYQIVTYESFANELKTLSAEAMRRSYSNRVIVFDEAQELRTVSRNIYEPYHKFTHSLENIKLLLLTGTPVWNRANDIAPLMNLGLALDEQLPTGVAFDREFLNEDKTLRNKKRLKDIFRGRVSYLRAKPSGVKHIDEGSEEYLPGIKLVGSVMSKFQAKIVNKEFHPQKGENDDPEEEEGSQDIYHTAREASNIVSPSGEFGSQLTKRFKQVKKKYDVKKQELVEKVVYSPDEEMKEALGDLEKYAAKYQTIVDALENHPDEKAFIYIPFIEGSGAVALALALERRGYRRVGTNLNNVLTSKEKRYILVSGYGSMTSTPAQITAAMEVMNDPRNMYGEYVRVIIGGKRLELGITLKDIRQYHMVMGPWNMATLDQSSRRGDRYGSHENLPPEKRYIRRYLHACIDPQGKETIDLFLYRKALEKDRENSQIYRLLSIMSVDCYNNLDFNRDLTAKDGSRDCHYDKCDFRCEGIDEEREKQLNAGENIDNSSYNLYYGDNAARALHHRVIDIFREKFFVSYEDLTSLSESSDLLLRVLDTIIRNDEPILNRYGFQCYLREQSNIYFLVSSPSDPSDFDAIEYVTDPILHESYTIEDLAQAKMMEHDVKVFREYCLLENEQKSEDMMQSFSFLTRIHLLEFAYEISKKGKKRARRHPVVKRILEELGGALYELDNGFVAHVLYALEFKGISYSVARPNFTVTGKTRIYDGQQWRFPVSNNEEKNIVDDIKTLYKEKKDEQLYKDNPYNVAVTLSKTDKLLRVHFNEPRNTGAVCKDAPAIILIKAFRKTGYVTKKDLKKYKNESEQDLRKRVIKLLPGQDKGRKIEGTHEDYSYILAILDKVEKQQKKEVTKRVMCDELREYFQDLGIFSELK